MNFLKRNYKYMILLLVVFLFSCSYLVYSVHEKEADITENNANIGMVSQAQILQEFQCENARVHAIGLNFASIGKANGTVEVALKDSDGVIQSWRIRIQKLKNQNPYKFTLKEKTLKRGETYYLDVRIKTNSGNQKITMLSENKQDGKNPGQLQIDGEKIENSSLAYSEYYTPSRLFGFAVVIFLTGGMAVVLLLMRKNIKTEVIVLVFLCTVGLVYFVLIPATAVPDEHGHYARSFEIANGYFLTPHGENGAGESYLPENSIPSVSNNLVRPTQNGVYGKEADMLHTQMNPEKTIIFPNSNQALYSPLSYIPQSIGIFIAKLFTNNLFIVFYAGRFATFLASLLLIYFAVKWIPYEKRMILLIVAMPVFLQEMISYSTDAVINALSIFILAYLLNMRREKKLKKKNLVFIWIMMIIVSMCKIVYLPFVLLVFLLKNESFSSKKKAWIYKITTTVTAVIANLGWLVIGFGYLGEVRPGVNSVEQVKYVLTHIPRFIYTAVATVYQSSYEWCMMMVGKLSWLNLQINEIIVLIFLFALIVETVVICKDEETCRTDKFTKYLLTFIIIAVIGLTFASLYVQWTPVAKNRIEGIQGRYFIPLLLGLPFIGKCVKTNIKKDTLMRIYLVFVFAANICAACEIYQFFA